MPLILTIFNLPSTAAHSHRRTHFPLQSLEVQCLGLCRLSLTSREPRRIKVTWSGEL